MQLLLPNQTRGADGTVYNADGSIAGSAGAAMVPDWLKGGSGFKKLTTRQPFKKALSIEEANAVLSDSVSATRTFTYKL